MQGSNCCQEYSRMNQYRQAQKAQPSILVRYSCFNSNILWERKVENGGIIILGLFSPQGSKPLMIFKVRIPIHHWRGTIDTIKTGF